MPVHILTFDVEDWFHLLDHPETSTEREWSHFESRIGRNTDVILGCLAEADVKATFFCLGWVAREHPNVVKSIEAAGHEIGSHSDGHRLVYDLTPAQFRADLEQSIKRIEDLTGRRVRAYRAPGFSITRSAAWAFSILAESGIEIDSSVFSARHSHAHDPACMAAGPFTIETGGGRLRVFPVVPGTARIARVNFAGGGYFRLLPFSVIRRLMRSSEYAVMYFHPRDFDATQPMVPNLPLGRRFKSYVGLRSSLAKFKALLNNFKLVDLAAANDVIDWSQRPRVADSTFTTVSRRDLAANVRSKPHEHVHSAGVPLPNGAASALESRAAWSEVDNAGRSVRAPWTR